MYNSNTITESVHKNSVKKDVVHNERKEEKKEKRVYSIRRMSSNILSSVLILQIAQI